MKRGIALLLTVVMAFGLTACGAKAKDPKEIYDAASKKSSELTSMDITSDINMKIHQGEDAMDMTMNLDMKFTDLNSDSMKYLAEGTTTFMGQDMDMSMYYEKGYYYMQTMGQKVKYAMDLQAMMEKIKQGTESSNIDSSYLKDITVKKEGDNQALTFTVDPDKMSSYVQDLMGQMGTNTEDVNYTIKEVSGDAVVNKDGYFSTSNIKLSLDMDVQGQTVSMEADIKSTYNNPGQAVEITAPDLEGYSEIDPPTL